MNQATKAIKAVSKTSHNTQIKKEQSKVVRDQEAPKSPWLEDYEDFSGRLQPVSKHTLDKIACDLIDYVENTDGILRYEWFFTSRKIYPFTARRWAAKYEQFGKITKVAKLILGMRREDGAMRKNFDAGIISATMPLYDDSWKEILQWREDMRAQTSIKVAQAQVESLHKPTQIILGQLAGVDYKALQDSKDIVE